MCSLEGIITIIVFLIFFSNTFQFLRKTYVIGDDAFKPGVPDVQDIFLNMFLMPGLFVGIPALAVLGILHFVFDLQVWFFPMWLTIVSVFGWGVIQFANLIGKRLLWSTYILPLLLCVLTFVAILLLQQTGLFASISLYSKILYALAIGFSLAILLLIRMGYRAEAEAKIKAKQMEPPSIHTMVVKEICFLIGSLVKKYNIRNGESITFAVNQDAMEWFRIRPRRYGESGGHYGIPEIIGHPIWISLIPTSRLKDVRLEVWNLAKERMPLGGHLMTEENRRRDVCGFAANLIGTLCDEEEKARKGIV